jgi:hypothetical protein
VEGRWEWELNFYFYLLQHIEDMSEVTDIFPSLDSGDDGPGKAAKNQEVSQGGGV